MVTQFCKQLGWSCMELLVSQFQARLQFGVCRELLDLLRLPMLNGLRARSLYKEGITCVADLAIANELNVERALYKALPFERYELIKFSCLLHKLIFLHINICIKVCIHISYIYSK